ncbi:MAG: ion channel, partial [Acidobacteriota bacterium]
WGWLDFLSSLPAIDVFRWGRTARIFRILRLLRGLRAARIVTHFVMFRRAECAFWTTALIAVLVIILGSIGILQLERGAGGNIESGPAALWWSFVTVTTVGYGDHYPITGGGRALAASLMLIGIGVFGTFTAYLATHFLDDGDSSAQEAQIAELASELAEVKRLLLEGRPGELEVSPGAAPTAPVG